MQVPLSGPVVPNLRRYDWIPRESGLQRIEDLRVKDPNGVFVDLRTSEPNHPCAVRLIPLEQVRGRSRAFYPQCFGDESKTRVGSVPSNTVSLKLDVPSNCALESGLDVPCPN